MLWCILALILPFCFAFGCLFYNKYIPYSSLIVATIAVSVFFVGGNVICAILVGSDATLHCVIFCVIALMCVFIAFRILLPYTLEPGICHEMRIENGWILNVNGLYCVAACGVVQNHGHNTQVCLLSQKSYASSPVLLGGNFFEEIGVVLTDKDKEDLVNGKFTLPVEVAKYDAHIVRLPIVRLSYKN